MNRGPCYGDDLFEGEQRQERRPKKLLPSKNEEGTSSVLALSLSSESVPNKKHGNHENHFLRFGRKKTATGK